MITRARMGAAAVVSLALGLAGCGGATDPGVGTVTRGEVTTTVTATGSLQAISQQQLGFPGGGRVTEIDVAVGQRVVPGQPLAKVDNTAQTVALRKARDEVTRQQALLDQITHGNQDIGGDSELGRYRDMLDSAHKISDETDRSDRAYVDQSQRQLDFDQYDLDRQLKILRFDHQRCPNYPSRNGEAPSSGGGSVITTNNNNYDDDDPCDRYEDRLDRISDARRRIVSDRNQVDSARKQRQVHQAQQQSYIDSAERDVTVARDKSGLAGTDKRFTGEAQSAVVDQSRADLITAQHNFDATIMRSSFHGIVGSISGRVGTVLQAAYERPDPAGGDVRTAAAPAGQPEALITLNDTPAFQMMVPFSAADAARISPDQPTRVTFDEIPGLSAPATVTSIAPTQAGTDGQNFLATVVLTQGDPRLHDGMTARAHVIVKTLSDVLTVPTSAVHGSGTARTVSLLGPDGSTRSAAVRIGTVGDPTSEVTSGLKAGDRVALPTGAAGG